MLLGERFGSCNKQLTKNEDGLIADDDVGTHSKLKLGSQGIC